MSEQVLGKRTRSSSPPTGDASGQPEAKRSTNATSPVENSADVPVEIANGAGDDDEDDDDDIGPMPDAPGDGGDEAVKGKKRTKKAGE